MLKRIARGSITTLFVIGSILLLPGFALGLASWRWMIVAIVGEVVLCLLLLMLGLSKASAREVPHPEGYEEPEAQEERESAA